VQQNVDGSQAPVSSDTSIPHPHEILPVENTPTQPPQDTQPPAKTTGQDTAEQDAKRSHQTTQPSKDSKDPRCPICGTCYEHRDGCPVSFFD